jgi:hypothetical protein
MLTDPPNPVKRHPIRVLLVFAVGGALAFGGFASASSGHSGAPANRHLSANLASGFVRQVAGQGWAVTGRASVLVPQRHASNSQTFTDPAGDSGNAPDITTVTVSNDDAGTITFAVTLANRASLSSEDMVLILLDADQNASTGSGGFDYAIGATAMGSVLLGWNGSDLAAASAPTLTASASSGVLTVRINRSDLHGTSGFVFGLGATGDGGDTVSEIAGPWTYQLVLGTTTTTPTPTTTTPTPTTTTPATPASTTKVRLLIDSPKTIPVRAGAGKRFTVTFPARFEKEEPVTVVDASTGQTRGDTLISWSPVPSGKMVCDPSVAGKVIAHSESFKNSQARLSFVIPKTAKGKLLKVSVKITATEKKTGKTVSATRIAAFRVR